MSRSKPRPSPLVRPSSPGRGADPRRRSWLSLALFLGLLAPLGLAVGCTGGEPTTTAPTTPTAPTAPTSPSSDASETTATSEGASSTTASTAPTGSTSATSAGSTDPGSTTDAAPPLADVLSVSVRGTSFSVELRSPDLGCSNYADWWEVVTPEGELVYRRILAHSHVDEQPFTRSGGPVNVGADDIVIVRAHMNPGGYGGQAMRGSAGAGFSADASITASFAQSLETSEPLPSGCAF